MIPENWAEKHPPPPPRWGKIFWHQIYPFQAISSNFGFCGRKASLPRMRENFLIADLCISGNFEQLWFLWQKSPPPPMITEIFLTSDLSISGNFEQLWFLWQKSPPPLEWGKIFWLQIYPFQAISSNFGFCGRKAPHDNGNFFDFRSIHFRQFWATLVFVAEKPSPPHPDEGKFFDIRSIHFRQFRATLVFVAEKPPPQDEGKIFWLQIYPFQAISSNFGFCGRKAPPPPW